jgi:hypothetical protein
MKAKILRLYTVHFDEPLLSFASHFNLRRYDLAELEEEIFGQTSGRFQKKTKAPLPINALKQSMIDKQVSEMESKMRGTLEAGAYTGPLLGFT